jgi:hypothetical protein
VDNFDEPTAVKIPKLGKFTSINKKSRKSCYKVNKDLDQIFIVPFVFNVHDAYEKYLNTIY